MSTGRAQQDAVSVCKFVSGSRTHPERARVHVPHMGWRTSSALGVTAERSTSLHSITAQLRAIHKDSEKTGTSKHQCLGAGIRNGVRARGTTLVLLCPQRLGCPTSLGTTVESLPETGHSACGLQPCSKHGHLPWSAGQQDSGHPCSQGSASCFHGYVLTSCDPIGFLHLKMLKDTQVHSRTLHSWTPRAMFL